LVHVRLANDDCARVLQFRDRCGVVPGHAVLEFLEGSCRPDIRGVVEILDADRNAVKRPAPLPCLDLGFCDFRALARLIAQNRDEGIQLLIERLNARQATVDDVDGRQFHRPDQRGEFADASVIELFFHDDRSDLSGGRHDAPTARDPGNA
jgi:hypothetical protein